MKKFNEFLNEKDPQMNEFFKNIMGKIRSATGMSKKNVMGKKIPETGDFARIFMYHRNNPEPFSTGEGTISVNNNYFSLNSGSGTDGLGNLNHIQKKLQKKEIIPSQNGWKITIRN
jgi:hypothetical protein